MWAWIATIGAIVALLALDLFVLNRKAHEIGLREALSHTVLFISCGVVFGVVVLLTLGGTAGAEYFSGYVVELSLSLDNVFVWALVFGYFGVPSRYQDRALLLGILGAIIFRVLFITVGITLLETLHWVIYIFGAFLLYTGVKLARGSEIEVHPEKNIVLRLLRRVMPVSRELHGQSFVFRNKGVLTATPLLGALIAIATLDVIFAVDSVPAVLAVTREPFLVVTATLFAILGLRALYFVLAGAMPKFVYLHQGLAAILIFIGAKMLLEDLIHIPTFVSLGIIVFILAVAVIASVIKARRDAPPEPAAGQG